MSDISFILFGGKGGVGKSTCSSAVARRCASLGQRTIIISSDMTPSLSDILEIEIGDAITEIDKDLSALEINQQNIARRWKEKFGRDFYEILSHLIDVDGLDGESRHGLLDYIGSAPSLREETILDIIVDMADSRKYDRIVWDTAPSGETLNLIGMPRIIRRHLRAGARVFEGLDRIGKQILGKRSISEIMDEWIDHSERISEFMRSRSSFVIVSSPEAIVVRQVPRILAALSDYNIHMHGMVINKVIDRSDSALMKELQTVQKKYIDELMDMAGSMQVALVPLSAREIRGKGALMELGDNLIRELNL